MVSLANGKPSKYDEIEDDNTKESTSLLGTSTSVTNVYQAKTNMQMKRDYKTDNISSADYEKNRSFFQRYLFDPLKYQAYFDTNTEQIKKTLIDALWPFFLEN